MTTKTKLEPLNIGIRDNQLLVDENEWLNLLKDKIDNIMQLQAKYDMECG